MIKDSGQVTDLIPKFEPVIFNFVQKPKYDLRFKDSISPKSLALNLGTESNRTEHNESSLIQWKTDFKMESVQSHVVPDYPKLCQFEQRSSNRPLSPESVLLDLDFSRR